MLSEHIPAELARQIAAAEHPRELALDVMFALQERYGWLNDAAVMEAAALLDMSSLEIEELATFYTFIYRQPVGRYVIHLCDSLICQMEGYLNIREYLSRKLHIGMGETTADGLFTLLPVCCIGYCDRAPAMLVNCQVYGPLTTEGIDALIDKLRREAP